VILLGAGFAIPAGIEAGTLKVLTGDLLYKQHGLEQFHNARVGSGYTPIGILRDYWWKLRNMLAEPLVYVLPLGVCIVGWWDVIRRRSRLLPFAAAGAFVLAYSLAGTTSFTRFLPVPLQERYLTPVLVYGAIAFGAALQGWLMSWSQLAIARTLACLIALQFVSAAVLAGERSGKLYFTEGFRNAQIALAALPDSQAPIYADEHIVPTLDVLLSGSLRTRLRPIQRDGLPELLPGYYVVLGRDHYPLSPTWSQNLPQISRLPCVTFASTPQGWSLWRPKSASTGAQDWAAIHWNAP